MEVSIIHRYKIVYRLSIGINISDLELL